MRPPGKVYPSDSTRYACRDARAADPDYIKEYGEDYYVTARGVRRTKMLGKVLEPSRGSASRATFRKSGAPADYKVRGKGFITICTSMPPDVFRKLVEIAQRENKNRSHMLRDLIEKHHASMEWKKP